MEFKLYYPQWKEKALTFSYDDGQIFDRRLVGIFDKYDLKATFHLNSGTLDTPGFVTSSELPELYKNHEIACHGVQHEHPVYLPTERLVNEFYQDRRALESYSGRIIRGCSYAFGEYDSRIVDTLQRLGFAYSRTVESTNDFAPRVDFMRWMPTCHHNQAFGDIAERFLHTPDYIGFAYSRTVESTNDFAPRVDFMRWMPTCHHNQAFGDIAERFLHTPDYMRLPLLYIWGHSFEFDRENTWEQMDTLCNKLHGKENIWYTTNIDYADYITAAKNLIFSADGSKAANLSATKLYVEMDGERRIL